MSSLGAGAGVLLGVLVGLRHAFEPDHLTAVATMCDANPRRGALVGAIWGVGHTISLVAVGIALVVLGDALPGRLAATFELAVAVVLVVLGVQAIVRAWRDGIVGATHVHRHGGREHVHAGPAAHVHLAGRPLAWRPLAVGLVHGLAGSGALTAIVFAQLPTTATRLTYITLFGLGSVAGMAAASAFASASLRAVPGRARRGLLCAAGALSIVLGVVWSLPLYAQLA